MSATFEIVNGQLFVTGNLDRATDQDLSQALEKYAAATPAPNRVVDMSNVRWLAPTGGKTIISAAQDANDKGGSLRVLASRHVLQTLNLLGAKSWVKIESCTTPNVKPDAEAPPAAAPVAPAAATAQPVASAPEVPAAQASAQAMAAPAPAPRASSSALAAVAPRAGALAGPAEELSGGAHLLRVLHSGRRYSFHFSRGDTILGIVRERVGGSWIMVETSGTRKIINLDVVEVCEIL